MIINSLLSNDLYKFCMQWAVIQKFPNVPVQYKFINRDDRKFTREMCYEIEAQIIEMDNLGLRSDEIAFLNKACPFLPAAYIDFLSGYTFNSTEVKVYHTSSDQLQINISGYWHSTILWEVPIMAIVSEVYNKHNKVDYDLFIEKTRKKALWLKENKIKFSDFGTRRRFSSEAQEKAVEVLVKDGGMIGTSNVFLAMKNSIKPIGTQAHEWYMAHGALFGYKAATKMALDNWVDVYQGSLGIALTDTYTTDVFLKSFDLKYAKLFDGVRHDSGEPIEFAKKIISHYRKLGIDPLDKTIVFSDSLNCDVVDLIEEYCCDKIKTSYGIGTNFTNDFEGVRPLNIVIKIVEAGGNKCLKVSDSAGKVTGSNDEFKLFCETMNL